MRRLLILDYALSSLWRRRYKNFSIIAVFTLTVAVLGSILLLTHSLKMEASEILAGAPDLVVQRMSAGRHDLIPVRYIEEIEKIPGVGAVKSRCWGYYYDALTGSNFTLLGLDETATHEIHLLEGSMPKAEGQCAVGPGVARIRNVKVGDELILIDSTNTGVVFEVVGTFTEESSILTNDLVVFPKDDLVWFFGLPEGRATDITVEVFNESEVSTVAGKIKRMYPDTRPITRREIVQTYDAVFNWRSGMMLTVFLSALIAFSILAWDKATGISAEERREVGILKAIGWDTSDVLELKFWEGTVVSLTSFLLGLIFAFVHVFFFGAPLLTPVLKGWSVIFPDFHFTPYIDLYQIAVIGFLTVVPYVASTVIPSWKTAVTDPEEVMRS